MERLSYNLLQNQGYNGYILKEAPERVLQFGEGNFLCAFADYFIDIANEKAGFNGKVCVVQPIATGATDIINKQEGLYTVYLRGYENGKRVNNKRIVSSISRAINPYINYQDFLDCANNPDLRYIISNTTEAGIAFDDTCRYDDIPPSSFPAKLTRFLYERYKIFGKEKGKGFIVLSCELIDNNGEELKKCVMKYIRLWNLGEDFRFWVDDESTFCSSMVDRIVTGYPKAEEKELNTENGYVDLLIDTGEVFGIWVIEGPEWLKEELPFEKAGLPVIVTRDCTPYKQRKVRILNGVQTGSALAAYLSGYDIGRFAMKDPLILNYMKNMVYDEIIPSLELPEKEKLDFAKEVYERLINPFIDHSLLAISLNSTAKWKARVLLSVKEYYEKIANLPRLLVFSFAAYLAFYHCQRMEDGRLIGKRNEDEYFVNDDQYVLDFFIEHKNDTVHELVQSVCSNEKLWGEDLTKLGDFADVVEQYLNRIYQVGMYESIKELV